MVDGVACAFIVDCRSTAWNCFQLPRTSQSAPWFESLSVLQYGNGSGSLMRRGSNSTLESILNLSRSILSVVRLLPSAFGCLSTKKSPHDGHFHFLRRARLDSG